MYSMLVFEGGGWRESIVPGRKTLEVQEKHFLMGRRSKKLVKSYKNAQTLARPLNPMLKNMVSEPMLGAEQAF